MKEIHSAKNSVLNASLLIAQCQSKLRLHEFTSRKKILRVMPLDKNLKENELVLTRFLNFVISNRIISVEIWFLIDLGKMG